MKKLILLLFLSLPIAVFGQQVEKGSGIILGIGGGHISSSYSKCLWWFTCR